MWECIPRQDGTGYNLCMGSNSEQISQVSPPGSLLSALRRVLRPLVHLLLAKGVTYPILADFLKSVYVEVADKDFEIEGKSQTDSRISLLSGVHRKDVKRLRQDAYKEDTIPAAVSLGAQLVARWTGDKKYRDKDGKLRTLSKLEKDGGALSFEALVKSVSKDIRSRAVLDEWLRLGIVTIEEGDNVRLSTDAFIPDKGFDEKAFYFGQNISNHLAASALNLLDHKPPFMDRSAHYDELSIESVNELHALARTVGMEAIHTISQRAMELEEQDKTSNEEKHRMNFGVFFYSQEDEKDSDDVM